MCACLFFISSKRSIECGAVQLSGTSSTRTNISPSKSFNTTTTTTKTAFVERVADKNCQWLNGTHENGTTTSALIVEKSCTSSNLSTTTTTTATVTVTVASLQAPTRQTSSFFTSKFMLLFSIYTHTRTHTTKLVSLKRRHTRHRLSFWLVHSSVAPRFSFYFLVICSVFYLYICTCVNGGGGGREIEDWKVGRGRRRESVI